MQNYFTDFFPALLKASWQAAVLILLILAAQWAFGRRLSPRWRYGLWLLVVARLALPWTISSPASLFNVLNLRHASASVASVGISPSTPVTPTAQPSPAAPPERPEPLPTIEPAGETPRLDLQARWLLLAWAAGALALAGCLALTQYRLSRKVTLCRPLIDAPVMNLLEDCKQLMDVRTPVTLVETAAVGSPSLFGFVRPRLLLPPGLTRSFSLEELRYVFLHELGHLKRHDILLGWVMTGLQLVHWFNPLVWVAFHRMRVDRELACDALALSYAKAEENQNYGRTIIKLLEGFGCSAWAPSLAGTVENKHQLKERIRMIANFEKTKRGLALAAALFAGLGLVTLTDAQTGSKNPAANPTAPATAAKAPPQIVSTSPEVGATEVDPGLKEITVTFDQAMGGGFSWTGGGPDYPPTPEGQKAHWQADRRTCVLPVKLEAGHYYRVGINSSSYRNFRSAAGVSAEPSAIYFTTQGASEELKVKTRLPRVVSFNPANGAQDVSPSLAELRVTFDVPMGGGFSWCGDGPTYPKGPEGQRPHWTEDGKTCVLPVQLQPNSQYELWLNSPSHKNFQSAGGVPLEPVAYSFKTGSK